MSGRFCDQCGKRMAASARFCSNCGAEQDEVFIREPIPPKVRFEILKRDSYACQYCGRRPPQVELEVDHIVPVSLGGDNAFENLTTACHECNRGKGSIPIDDELYSAQRALSVVADELRQIDRSLLALHVEQFFGSYGEIFLAYWGSPVIAVSENGYLSYLTSRHNREFLGGYDEEVERNHIADLLVTHPARLRKGVKHQLMQQRHERAHSAYLNAMIARDHVRDVWVDSEDDVIRSEAEGILDNLDVMLDTLFAAYFATEPGRWHLRMDPELLSDLDDGVLVAIGVV